MPKYCADAVYREGRCFLELYNNLAYESLRDLDLCLYAMKPKLHMVAHTSFDMSEMIEDRDVTFVPSPLIYCCEPNEDNIGRISRISRRVHQSQVCRTTIERYLMKTKALYERYQRNPKNLEEPQIKRRRCKL